MRLPLAYALLLTSPLLAACFRPDLVCLPCQKTCPGSLRCQENYCVESAAQIPYCRNLNDDAGARPDVAPAPPDVPPGGVCSERCCIGDSCLEFPQALQRGLLLWADRTTLPPAGQLVERWRDRSPMGNDILNVNHDKAPRVQQDEIGPIAEIDDVSMVLATRPGPQLRLESSDFTMLIVARCDSGTRNVTLLDRITPIEPRSGLRLMCNHNGGGVLGPDFQDYNRAFFKLIQEELLTSFDAGAVASARPFQSDVLRLYVARRVGGELQLRVDGRLDGRAQIPESLSLMADSSIFIGAVATSFSAARTEFNGGIATVVIVKGPLADQELGELERFLMATSGPRVPAP